jgi:hypothetical protein
MAKYFNQLRNYINDSVWSRRILFALIGACGGYAYYHFIGCASGSCPITGNPYVITIYGAGIGFVLTPEEKKKT